ncbi:MAG: 50S ribosomal protein L15 [Thaumarchaeota archaeon]|nr:50S ribosomal protein L15 [Candidatus Terraquivivens yellowstonensis]MCL7392117.1 50S ribosomal protein L15 [Candidatus Terraquivivens yellowstonensis]MCL7395079.1 50S ribosomal protein L15 [Candidatus Terraquivivens yellowstonensis]MCL7397919.1 50S ribosomal protein L15 [Candidatus Terraquivivens yellowstonensis]MCL7399307.1 50S ribosomal protein L15 [Candidatus Terraquivivens yellowstonensis]
MPTRLRKIRKLRGSRTCGWGQIGQHRKTGSKGGRGMAGGHKHKWTWILKYAPDYFGKHGFFRPNRKVYRAINLKQLSELAETLEKSENAQKVDNMLLVNLKSIGIEKLLGGGDVYKPLLVVVERWTEQASKKISDAGGKIIKPEELTALIG